METLCNRDQRNRTRRTRKRQGHKIRSQNAEVVFSYRRAEAIADGVLVDVSKTAKEAGFCYPVAPTHPVWSRYVEVPEGVKAQDEAGRLWDILTMLRFAIKRGAEGPELRFQLHVRNDDRKGTPPLVELKSVCGPDDDASPCLTVMLPEED
jgi:hypothetical protein